MSHEPPASPLSRFHRHAAALARLAHRRPWSVLAVAAVCVAIGGWGTSQLRVDQDLKALLPASFPSVRNLEQLERRVGAQSDLLVEIRSPSRAANRRFGAALARRLRAFPELRYVLFRRGVAFFRRNALLYLPLAELLSLHERVVRRIRREVARRTVVDLEDDDEAKDDGRRGALGYDPEAEFRKALGGAEAPREYLEADGGRLLVLKARPVEQTTNVAFARRLVRKVRAAIAACDPQRHHPRMTARVRGEYRERVGEQQGISGEVLRTVAFAVALLLLIIAAYFRRARSLAIVLLPIVGSTVCTFGLGALLYGTFNLVTVFIFAVLLGLGIDFALHSLTRYSFERRRGRDNERALAISLGSTGAALMSGALTTVVVFFLLQLARFRGFSQFGVMAGIGVLLALLATFTVVPALVTVFERWRPARLAPLAEASRRREPRGGRRSGWLVAALLVVIVSAAAAAGSLWRAPQIAFEYDFSKLGTPKKPREKREGPRVVDYRKAVGKVTTFGQSVALCRTARQCADVTRLLRVARQANARDMALIFGAEGGAAASRPASGDPLPRDPFAELRRTLAGGRLLPADRRLLRGLGRERVEEMRHFVRAHLGLHAFVPSHQRQKLKIIADIRRRVERKRASLSREARAELAKWERFLAVRRPIGARDLPRWIVQQLQQKDGRVGRFVIIYNRGTKADYADAKRLHTTFATLPTAGGPVPVAANYMVLTEVIDTLREDGPVVLGAAAGAVMLCLLVLFRSLRAAVLVLIPLLASISWLAGAYLLGRWKLNTFSIVAFPLLVGMGIDNGIHVYHRWREARSAAVVLREVGGPICLATLTTLIGFAGLLFAKHVGVQTLGLTAALGMALALVGSLATLPATLVLLDRPPRDSGA